jgi:alpha-tubulin suppressor-like RCC1 family protein
VRTRHLPLTTTALALGSSHSCALTEEGAVRCWGRGTFGQLGNRTWDDSLLPRGVRRLQSGVTAIAAGQHHTCAILEGGDLRCWGASAYGQLGNNSRVSRNIPIGTWGMRYRTVSAVALGARHTCALEDNGRVWCWGDGREGQLGMGDLAADPNDNLRYTPVRMLGRNFGPVEGTAMATFLTDPLPRRRHVFQARFVGSHIYWPSWSDVLPHRVTR